MSSYCGHISTNRSISLANLLEHLPTLKNANCDIFLLRPYWLLSRPGIVKYPICSLELSNHLPQCNELCHRSSESVFKIIRSSETVPVIIVIYVVVTVHYTEIHVSHMTHQHINIIFTTSFLLHCLLNTADWQPNSKASRLSTLSVISNCNSIYLRWNC